MGIFLCCVCDRGRERRVCVGVVLLTSIRGVCLHVNQIQTWIKEEERRKDEEEEGKTGWVK